jgi:hypothetical protein
LGRKNHYKQRKIHKAAAIHIETNVISQPSYEIPPLRHSILGEERRQIIRERKPRRKEEKQRDKKMAKKRGREEEEASSGRKLRTELAVVDRRHRHKMQLRRTIRRPVRLIEVCDTN